MRTHKLQIACWLFLLSSCIGVFQVASGAVCPDNNCWTAQDFAIWIPPSGGQGNRYVFYGFRFDSPIQEDHAYCNADGMICFDDPAYTPDSEGTGQERMQCDVGSLVCDQEPSSLYQELYQAEGLSQCTVFFREDIYGRGQCKRPPGSE